jgi:sialate O-acetylesterase
MQVHNADAQQTLFAFNHWRTGERADLGIGNRDEQNPNWTFAGNAQGYVKKRLRVLVRMPIKAKP